MGKKFHPKIKDLQLRATPINFSGFYVDEDGQMQMPDLKLLADQNERTIKGYLSVWDVKDSYGTAFKRGCFKKSIQERGPQSQAKQKIIHLWQHIVEEPTGQFTVLNEDDYGLYFEVVLDDVPISNRELTQVNSGTLNQFSVGFNYLWDKVEYDESEDVINIYEAELFEGSVVTFASNAETYAIRSPENLIKEKDNLINQTEDFIKSLPRRQHLELRELITKHISLAKIEPDNTPLQIRKPMSIDYDNLNTLLKTKNIFI